MGFEARRSLNEVAQLSRRASVGVGLPNGLEAEIGFAAMWLEGWALGGMQQAAVGLNRYQSDTDVWPIGIVHGTELFDELFETQKQNAEQPITWERSVYGPIGLVPYAVKRSTSGASVHLSWGAGQHEVDALALCTGGTVRLRYNSEDALLGAGRYACKIAISPQPAAYKGTAPRRHALEAWQMERRYERAVSEAVLVSEQIWADLTLLADATMVSEE